MMALHPMVFATLPDGSVATVQDLAVRVDTLPAAEPFVQRYLAKARRMGAVRMVIDVWDGRACVSAFRGRVK